MTGQPIRQSLLFAAVLTTAPASLALAQRTVPASVEFEYLVKDALELLNDETARSQRRTFAIERVPGLDPAGAAASIDRATLGINTDVEGASAGLAFSPFALAGSTDPRKTAFNVFVGALGDQETRVGLRYAWRLSAPSLEKGSCRFDLQAEEKRLVALTSHYEAVCKVMASASSKPRDIKDGIWQVARAACRVPGSDYPNPGDRNLAVVLVAVGRAVEALRTSEDADLTSRLDTIRTSIDVLKTTKVVDFSQCYQSEEDLAEQFRRVDWKRGDVRFGVSSSIDFFPRQFGFSPDGSQLPSGELKAWQSRLDLSVRRGRAEWTFGLGGGSWRDEFTADHDWSLTPALSLSCVAFSLASGPLLDPDGVIRVVKGKVVPHAVIGFLVSAELALTRPDWQPGPLKAFDAQAFIDFKISESLSFRLGVPIEGRLQTRPADDAAGLPKLSKLQWTVPVALVTVLKL